MQIDLPLYITAKTSWLFQPQLEWLPWLQINWRADSGYEKFALVLETNCKRQPKGQLPSSSYNHNRMKTQYLWFPQLVTSSLLQL